MVTSEKQNAEMMELAKRLSSAGMIFGQQSDPVVLKMSLSERDMIVTALRAAPSPHPRGEPVAWQIEINGIWQNLPGDWSESENNPNHVYRPLYAAPPPAGADAVREALELRERRRSEGDE